MMQNMKTKKMESGRSLTEMLGTLAIMAVITVVGVKLFNSAMTQHRANELINEAQKRAVTIAAQIMAGRENLSVGEFNDPEGYVFNVEKKNEYQFNITLDQVDPDICSKLKSFVGGTTTIRKINDTCTLMTFNNDLSTPTPESCMEKEQIYCDSIGRCSETGNCCAGGGCVADSCPSGASTNGARAGGTTGIFVSGTQCICDVATDVYTGGAGCITKPATCTSWTTNECGFGYFCEFAYDEQTNYVGTEGACYQNLSGTCKKIMRKEFTDAQKAALAESGFKDSFVLIYAGLQSWWSANSWCLGQGKHLIDVSEMDCYYQGNELTTAANTGTRGCCKKGERCDLVGWRPLWDGMQIVAGKEADAAKYNNKIIALRKIQGGTYFWLATPYGNTSQNSCNAFYAYTNDGGYVSGRARSNAYSVFCE